jgi:hypothetical protein
MSGLRDGESGTQSPITSGAIDGLITIRATDLTLSGYRDPFLFLLVAFESRLRFLDSLSSSQLRMARGIIMQSVVIPTIIPTVVDTSAIPNAALIVAPNTASPLSIVGVSSLKDLIMIVKIARK